MARSNVDVVIVGAGAAGLAAAKRLRTLRLTVALIEAAGRIGGRAQTDTLTLGVPVDTGAHWMHAASINPFVRIAEAHGFAYRRRWRHPRLHTLGAWADARERRDRLAFFNDCYARIHAAAAAGRDVPIASVTRRDERWTALFDHWIALMSGVDPTDASTADYGNFRDTGENWPVKDGFGALVASFGRDEPVALATPVEAIDWGGRWTGVRTRAGAIRARAVIVTVSTGVLASGAIRFEPGLPAWKRDAIAALPMGRLNKVAIRFGRDAFGVPPLYVHSDTGSTETMGFQLNPFGRPLAIGYVGGRFSDSLERAGPAAMSAYAVERLKAMFGSSIGRLVRASLCTRWGRNRRTLGSYSAARPGEAARRALLATPLGDRLFFAGEAASPDSFSTVHGAYLTGIAAAKAVARALRRRD